MTILVVVLVWLLVLPVAGIVCARVLGFGERPSAPRRSWAEQLPVTAQERPASTSQVIASR